MRLGSKWAMTMAVLLALLPISIQAQIPVFAPNTKVTLPELQKALGHDWSVTALPDGYSLTYAPLVNFYPATTASSKMGTYQRMSRGRTDRLCIRIVFGPVLSKEEINKIDRYGLQLPEDGLKNIPHYFFCEYMDGGAGVLSADDRISFVTNYSPYELVSPPSSEDVYNRALGKLGVLLHCMKPVIED